MPRRRHRSTVAGLLTASLLLVGNPVAADDHESRNSGHPLRVAAYVLHPVGVILDTVIARPLHWLASRGPMKTLFGHESRTGDLTARDYEEQSTESPED